MYLQDNHVVFGMGAAEVLDIRLLGPVEVHFGEHMLDIGGPKQRALLAVLALSANKAVPREVLIDRLWPDRPPDGAQHTLDVYASRLRKALEVDGAEPIVLARSGAYLLRIPVESIDVSRFERLAASGRRALAGNAARGAADDLSAALTLWRGEPLADISQEPFAQPEVARLNELRLGIIEDRIEADLALGRHAAIIGELGALVAVHPFRERLYQLLMIALYRCGRQAEALAVYQQGRRVLVEELGVEPSPALQRTERAVLEQDATLDPPRVSRIAALGQGDQEQPTAMGGRRARVLAAAGTSLALAVALLIAVAGSRAVAAAPYSVAVIDAGSGAVTADAAGVGRPAGVARGAGATWVTDSARDMLVEVTGAGQVADRIPVGRGPSGVVVGDGEVWVANEFDNTVSEINPAAQTEVKRIPVGNGPAALAYGYGSVWVANVTDWTVSRINVRLGVVTSTHTIALGGSPAAMAAGDGGIWVATTQNAQSGQLLLIDPRTDRVTKNFPADPAPGGVAVGAGSVWVSDATGFLQRFNPSTGARQRIPVAGTPVGVAYADGAVWVANGKGSVLRFDARTAGVVGATPVRGEPSSLAAAGGVVLLTVLPSLASHRGGTLTLVSSPFYMPAGAWSDPAVAWDYYDWQILTMTNDGLVGYRRVGGPAGNQVVPDLARSLPTPTGHGTTYTFRLRAGIRYSNGRLVRAQDFRRALERDFVINNGGGRVAFFYSGIVGAAACERRPQHCDLAQGVVTNDKAGTVTIHLMKADPDFLDKLALPFADAVPAGTPLHQVTLAQLQATGPYRVRSITLTRWILVRNPQFRQWSAQAQPAGYPDRIVLLPRVPPAVAVRAVERGSADVMFTQPPVSALAELKTKYANLLHAYPLGGTVFLFLNTRIRPFNVLAARQAVSDAIDRRVMIHMMGGTALPTCQVLPPGFPGYVRYCPWPAPDMARARQLVTASGTRGAKVTVVTGPLTNMPSGRAAGNYLVSVLHKLGYKTSLRAFSGEPGSVGKVAYINTINDPASHIQLGEFTWDEDFPAPSDFYVPLLTCPSIIPNNTGGVNVSKFCDSRIDLQIKQAMAAQTHSPNSAAAWSAWTAIDHQVADQAPLVPLYNPQALIVLSPRVGNFQFHPFWELLIDQLWVR
jgi:YVTN family beta-propeller protein